MSVPNRGRVVLAFAVLISFALGGCWRHSQISTLEEARSYLRLIGDLEGVELSLDGSEAMELLGPHGKTAKNGTLWQVLPGRHLVELYRSEQRILRRDLYVGHDQVLDIAVPR